MNDDFHFSLPNPQTRAVVNSSATATGLDGSTLFVESPSTSLGGTGEEPVGFLEPSTLAQLVPGLAVVTEIHAVVSGNPSTDSPS